MNTQQAPQEFPPSLVSPDLSAAMPNFATPGQSPETNLAQVTPNLGEFAVKISVVRTKAEDASSTFNVPDLGPQEVLRTYNYTAMAPVEAIAAHEQQLRRQKEDIDSMEAILASTTDEEDEDDAEKAKKAKSTRDNLTLVA